METQKNNNSLKAIVAVLALFLGGSLYYIFKMTNEAKTLSTEIKNIRSEKDIVLDSLAVLKTKYDTAIEDNTALSDDLIAEREKVMNLIADVKKSKGDTASMSKYKEQFNQLQLNMKTLIAENDALKKENQTLAGQRDSTIVVIGKQKIANDTLSTQNQNLAKNLANTIEKGSKLSVLNLQTAAIKQRSSGKQIETDKASRANILKISFMIAENQIAKAGDKTYYIQIIDSKNNVIGEKKTETFGEKTLTYSFISAVKYENKTIQVAKDLPVENLESGDYFVNIFDKTELVSKTSFNLR